MRLPFGKGPAPFGIAYGARVIDSTPPAMNTSPSPARIARAAVSTVNRLCGSGLEAVLTAARAIRAGEGEVFLAGGVESMTRAPYVMPKAPQPFPNGNLTVYDTSLGWRFPNPRMEALFPLEAMGETAENLVERYELSRADQDAFAVESHRKALAADFTAEIVPVPRAGPRRA